MTISFLQEKLFTFADEEVEYSTAKVIISELKRKQIWRHSFAQICVQSVRNNTNNIVSKWLVYTAKSRI